MACHTQEEIAEAVGWEQRTVSNWIDDFSNFGHMSNFSKTLTNHADEKFERPVCPLQARGEHLLPHMR